MSPPEYANLEVTQHILYMFHVDNIPTIDAAEICQLGSGKQRFGFENGSKNR
jgi:hypothetical protein